MPDPHAPTTHAPASLDPESWGDLREACDAIAAAAIEFLATRRDQPVWTKPTPEAVARFRRPLPRAGAPLDELLDDLVRHVLPHSVGNTHPRFFGWVHGSGSAASIVPEILKAAMNVNAGGREHIAPHVERQVIAWSAELFGLPPETSGVLTTGTSLATLICLIVARDRVLGPDARELGLGAAGAPLALYTSREAHTCVLKAAEMMGLGRASVREIDTDPDHRMDPRALARAIDADVAAGARPVAVVATAGTVNVGAIDPIDHVAGVCAERGVWLHVDAAFGAAALLSPSLRPRLAGVERCDSASFDFHKWFHAPYATGCALVRRADEHLASFSTSPHYLASFGEGVSAGRPWACDLGPDLSRPFNALPVWFTLQHHGADRLAEVVERNVRLATRLAEMVDDHPRLERLAPTPLNIVCFRYVPDAPASPGALDDLNAAIITRLQISGVAAPSSTRIDGALAIRVNLTNHRTTEDDLRILVEAIERLGGELAPAIAP